jgi:outer membrane protein assembly factor BamB
VRRVAVSVLLVAVACGARTGLLAPSDTSAPVEAGPPLPDGAAVVPGTCTSQLQPGAPTPIAGYCSTRAHLAPAELPVSPKVAWRTALPMLVTAPLEIAVDATGRIYATLDTNFQDDATEADAVVAFDPDGTPLWSLPTDGTGPGKLQDPRSLWLASDGSLAMIVPYPTPQLVTVSRDGALGATHPLPENVARDLAVGRDGSLYIQVWPSDYQTQIEKLSPEGEVLWTSATLFTRCSFGTSTIALTQDDVVIVAFATILDDDTDADLPCLMPPGNMVTRLMALGPTGSVSWQHDFPGVWTADPVVALDGTLRMGLAGGNSDAAQEHLVSIDGAGDVLWDTTLPDDSLNTGEDPVVVGRDGTAVVRTGEALVGVSASGAILWRDPLTAAYAYDVVVDAAGEVVVSEANLYGLDLATGAMRWSLPNVTAPFAVGASGSIVGTITPGQQMMSLFLAQ